MKQEAVDIVKPFGTLAYGTPEFSQTFATYKEYKNAYSDDPEVYSEDSFKTPDLDELYRAYRDLSDSTVTLNKYKVQLDQLVNFDKEDKIPVIWDFIQNWKNSVYDFYIENADLYISLKQNYTKASEEYKQSEEYVQEIEHYEVYYKGWRAEMEVIHNFEKEYYAPILGYTKSIVECNRINTEKLTKDLEKEAMDRYKVLVKQVTEITGEITDVSHLKMSADGLINGIIKGVKGTVKVDTFPAGGYNTDVIVNVKHGQIFHYRTKVTKVA